MKKGDVVLCVRSWSKNAGVQAGSFYVVDNVIEGREKMILITDTFISLEGLPDSWWNVERFLKMGES